MSPATIPTDAIPQGVRNAQAIALRLVGARVVDRRGTRVGRVAGILVDRTTGEVCWLHVRLGRFGGDHVALPHRDFTSGAGVVCVTWTRGVIDRAPRVGADGALTSRTERGLAEHFGGASSRIAVASAWERRATAARLLVPGRWEPMLRV